MLLHYAAESEDSLPGILCEALNVTGNQCEKD